MSERHETGIDLIAAERARQVSEEGWTPEHDDGHVRGQIAMAAACYAAPKAIYTARKMVVSPGRRKVSLVFSDPWPWRDGDKREPRPETDGNVLTPEEAEHPELVEARIRELVKAGALIAAEIDRLERLGDT